MSMRRYDNHGPPEKVDSRFKHGGNMRMDRKPNATRISDPSHPAGKRKEIDNVMKKARQASPNEYWDKKLLEAEEKAGPGRWKHSGYKKMYVDGVRKSRSRSRSPVMRNPVSPVPVRRRTPERYRPKSPPPPPPPSRYARKSPPPPRAELKAKELAYRPKPRQMSPKIKPANVYPNPHRPSQNTSSHHARTPSISSCSDSQCSGCSSDEDDRRLMEPKRRYDRHGPTNRIRTMSIEEVEHISSKKNKIREISPKRRHMKRPASPPSRREIASPIPVKKKDRSEKTRARIKIEGEKRRHRSPSTASEDSTSSESYFPALTATTRITLNERFGKMAQWNNDRKYDMGNMKITKSSEGGDRSAVMIQEQTQRESSPVRQFSFSQYTKGEGHFPEELMQHSSAQAMGLSAWDDVRVRFDYYKSKGYLRDLTISDYIKWEEWWYRYQEWLKQERYFEMVERNMRRRRKKIPIQQRLN